MYNIWIRNNQTILTDYNLHMLLFCYYYFSFFDQVRTSYMKLFRQRASGSGRISKFLSSMITSTSTVSTIIIIIITDQNTFILYLFSLVTRVTNRKAVMKVEKPVEGLNLAHLGTQILSVVMGQHPHLYRQMIINDIIIIVLYYSSVVYIQYLKLSVEYIFFILFIYNSIILDLLWWVWFKRFATMHLQLIMFIVHIRIV